MKTEQNKYWNVNDIIIYHYPAGGYDIIIITKENQTSYPSTHSLYRKAPKKKVDEVIKKLESDVVHYKKRLRLLKSIMKKK